MQSTCKEGDKQALWFCGNKSSKSVKQDSDNIILKVLSPPFPSLLPRSHHVAQAALAFSLCPRLDMNL